MGEAVAAAWVGAALASAAAAEGSRQQRKQEKDTKHKTKRARHQQNEQTAKSEADQRKAEEKEQSALFVQKQKNLKSMQGSGSRGRKGTIKTSGTKPSGEGSTTGSSTAGGKNLLGL